MVRPYGRKKCVGAIDFTEVKLGFSGIKQLNPLSSACTCVCFFLSIGSSLNIEGITFVVHIYHQDEGHPIKLDLYPPSNYSPSTISYKTAIVYHGGGLTVGNRRQWIPLTVMTLLHQRDWVIISACYHLLPESTTADIRSDVEALQQWLLTSHKEVWVDLARISTLGSSAGMLLHLRFLIYSNLGKIFCFGLNLHVVEVHSSKSIRKPSWDDQPYWYRIHHQKGLGRWIFYTWSRTSFLVEIREVWKVLRSRTTTNLGWPRWYRRSRRTFGFLLVAEICSKAPLASLTNLNDTL